jgi:hypothetical protein
MGREESPPNPCSERDNNRVRTDGIRTVDLHDDDWSDSSLFRPDDGVEITENNIPPSNAYQRISPRASWSS